MLESWRGKRRDGGVLIDIETDAIVTDGLSMPTRRANGATPRCGLLVVDLRDGDIVQRFWLRGDKELFDVGVIPNIRCPRGLGPYVPGLEEAMRDEKMEQSVLDKSYIF